MITYEWDIEDASGIELPGYKIRMTFRDEEVEELKAVLDVAKSKHIFVYDIAVDISCVQVEIVHPDGDVERYSDSVSADAGLYDGHVLIRTSVALNGRECTVVMNLGNPQYIVKDPTTNTDDH